MTTIDLITELFCRVDDQMPDAKKHSQASFWPSEVVTLALLFTLKGVGNRAFYRWLKRDYLPLFPTLPCRTRLFRLFSSHRKWVDRFMAEPSLIGVIDTYGIELIHPQSGRLHRGFVQSLGAMAWLRARRNRYGASLHCRVQSVKLAPKVYTLFGCFGKLSLE